MDKVEAPIRVGRVYPVFQDDLWYTEHYLAKELFKLNIPTTFITSDQYRDSWLPYLKKKYPAGEYNFQYYSVIRLKAFFPFEQVIFKNPFKLYKKLFEGDFNILHVYGVGTLVTLQILLLSLFAGSKRLPIVFSDHSDTRTHKRSGLLPQFFFKGLGLILKSFENRYYKIITFSDVSAGVISKKLSLGLEKFEIIPLGYDQELFNFNPALKNTSEKFIIGFAGKITPSKRIDFLFNQIHDGNFIEKVKVIIVGYKDDEYGIKLKSLAHSLGIEVEFRPFTDSKGLAEFYNHIDLAVFPGGISITTIEANGCGTPVLIYESIEGLEERVEQGRGFLFKTEDEFTDRLKLLYDSYEKQQINNLQIETVTREKYSWQFIKNKYLDIYKTSLENGRQN